MYIRVLEMAESLLQPPISQRLKSGYVILKTGEEVGEHCTDDREEMLIIMEGTALIQCAGESAEVNEHSVVYIPKNMRHNVINQAPNDLKYIYLVTPVV